MALAPYWMPAWPISLSLCVCVKKRERGRSLGFGTFLLSLGTIWAGAGLDRAGQRVINVHQWPVWHCQEIGLHHSLITTRIQGYWDNKAASKTERYHPALNDASVIEYHGQGLTTTDIQIMGF